MFRRLLVGRDDHQVFPMAHPEPLPFFADPLVPEHERHGYLDSEADIPLHDLSQGGHKGSQSAAHTDPPLRSSREASTIQLFYDLFFVANLTTFTGVHEINDTESLKSYIGFFSVLWFTWLQVSLFDVRFGIDSIFERICKASQFGVMVGLAITGPGYKTGWSYETEEEKIKADEALAAFRHLSIILMFSRLVLMLQYSSILVALKNYRKAFLPLIGHILVLLIATMVYLGLYFQFRSGSLAHSYIGWYVLFVFEVGAILFISGQYKFMSFRKTGIVERMGLLTLIIIGEGVIGLCSSIRRVGQDDELPADIIGMIICGVIIIYSLWMIYFDNVETERVGTIRQQLWVMAHFPFHIGILLVLEGAAQLSVWRKIWDVIFSFRNEMPDFPMNTILESTMEIMERVDGAVEKVFHGFSESKIPHPVLDGYIDNLTESISSKNESGQTWASTNIEAAILKWVAASLDVEESEKHARAEAGLTEAESLYGLFHVFRTVFLYFFAAAGLVLIISSLMVVLGKRHKVRADWYALSFRVMAGVFIISLIFIGTAGTLGLNYLTSPMLLPSVAIVYALVVFMDNLLVGTARRIVTRGTYTRTMSS